ncbi:MAG: hypothetical protein M9921_15055 [Fimbriimonadaceae bacterium]|nr:hypothetical protein [Fimbriimonadaceae bacterium]
MLAIFLTVLMAQNALANSSFERVAGDVPVGWTAQRWGGEARFSVSNDAHSGNRSVEVASSTGADAGWQQSVAVRPYSRYRLTAWIKTVGVETVERGPGALINLHGRPEHTEPVAGTRDWTRVEMTIDTGADDALLLNCLLGYFGTAKGTARFDDLELTLLETRTPEPKAVIDAAHTSEPIPKYLYSQFIEHLGRCIYGGIWAEMLQDRKFYDAVGAKESPWEPIGAVGMTTEKPFVGAHSPRLEAGAAVSQGGIWFEKNRPYSGYAWVRSVDGKGSVVLRFVCGEQASEQRSFTIQMRNREYVKIPFSVALPSTTQQGRFEIAALDGPIEVGTASLMPSDNVRGMRRDTLALLKELNAPLYRWPGGNFVSGYNWRDGIGDRDHRPPRKNPAWQGIEHNDFGTHEFLDFCKELGTEPLIVVNTGLGKPSEAAAWLEYVNGAAATPEGSRRAANGHAAPWSVDWWGIGNEMYGDWQLGHMPLAEYTVKNNAVVDAMRAVDPKIKTIASGDVGSWSLGMLTECANHMTLISEHFYCQERPGVMAHAAQVPNAIRAKVVAHRRYRDTLPSLKGHDIRIAMDEWNYWYGPHVFGELGTRYFMKDALGIAEGLHEYFRSTDIVAMAQYAQTVNVIGCIKTTPTAAAFETTGLVLKLYRERFGAIPLAVAEGVEPLDVSAARTADGRFITLGVVNPTGAEITLPLTWKGVRVAAQGTGWEIAHPDPMAYNDPGGKQPVQIVDRKFDKMDREVKVKPYSVTVVRVGVGP